MVDEFGSNPNPAKDQLSSLPSHGRPNPSGTRRFNLLLAEDNLPDTLLVREAIRMENLPLEIFIVSDGQKAIEFIERAESDPEAPCPQFVLLDLNLPKRDGFEVLDRLRASTKCKDVPVVIVTSSDAPADLKRATERGAGYFRKPPSYQAFLKLGTVLKQLMLEKGALEQS
jgi:CheY-like chemotaxis protein